MARTKSEFSKPPEIDAPLSDWALWHWEHGSTTGAYRITPLRPGEKKPYLPDWTRKPFKTRSAVIKHWKEHPDDNIGLVPQPGFFWLDADDVELLEDAEEDHGCLPSTYSQRSINDSLHFLFKGDVSGSPAVKYDGKRMGEIRGASSGQCVGAGSRGTTKDGKPGHWEIEELKDIADSPKWLNRMIGSTKKPSSKSSPPSKKKNERRKDYGEALPWDHEQAQRLVSFVMDGKLIKDDEGAFPEGERNNLIFQLFAEALNRMIHPDAILSAILDSGIDGGLDHNEVSTSMWSVYHADNARGKYGSKVQRYWLPNYVFSAVVDGQSVERPPADPVNWKAKNRPLLPNCFPGDPQLDVTNEDNENSLVHLTFSEVLAKEPEPVAEIIPDRIEKGVVNFLSGAGGSHKSRLALQYCVSLAARIPVFGKQPAEAWPVYLSAEDGEDEIIRRMHMMSKRLGIHPKTSLDCTSYLDRQGRNNALACMREGGGYELSGFYGQLGNYLAKLSGHKFVVLDSCYDYVRFEGSSKINEDAVNAFVKEVLGNFCRETDSTLLLPWHPSYSGQARGDGSGWSVAWNNAPRVRDQIRRIEDSDSFELTAEKRSHGAKPPPLILHYSDGALMPIDEIEVSERNEELTDAIVDVATIMAERNIPLQQHRRVGRTELDLLRDKIGFSVKPKEMKDALQRAVVNDSLKYVKGDKYHSAGYYSRDGGEELAKEVKRSKNEEKSVENSRANVEAKTRPKRRKNRG